MGSSNLFSSGSRSSRLKYSSIEYEDDGTTVEDNLLDDEEGDIVKIITSDGKFFIIAQNIDGHGHLSVVKESK